MKSEGVNGPPRLGLTFIQLTEPALGRKSWSYPMTLEGLFTAANYTVLPFWLLLIAAPRWSWTQRLVHSPVVLLLLTPIYAYMLLGYAPAPKGMDFTSLYGVMIGFSSPHIVVAAWIHLLVFDLFVGAWEVRDAQRREIPHLLVVPCLLATLLMGPVGLLIYVLLRFAARGAIELDEAQ